MNTFLSLWIPLHLNDLFSSVQPLDVALKGALKGELEDVVLSLLMPPAQYDASLLKNAMKVTLFPNYIQINFTFLPWIW